MKILFLSKLFYPHIGGVEKHVLMVSRELVKLGNQVTILTLKSDFKLKSLELIQGIKVVRLPYCKSKWGIWRQLWLNRKLIQQADLVHCHDIFFWYLPFCLLLPFKPIFTTFHGWEGIFPIPFKNLILRKFYEWLSWGNICIGDYLAIWYKTQADYISYGGVEPIKIKSIKPKTKHLVFIGRLEADLGLLEYFKAFKILKKQGYKITFVGDGPLRRQAAKLGQVIGKVTIIQPYLLSASHVFCSSYLTIWEALRLKRQVFALYQNDLKKDYLIKFSAAKYIHISSSAQELISQISQILPSCPKFPKWSGVAKIYLQLWQKK